MRIEENKKILEILKLYIEANPDIRFFQMLYNLGITECEPLYNMESKKILEKMINEPLFDSMKYVNLVINKD